MNVKVSAVILVVLICAAFFLFGCTTAPICGDGFCNENETNLTCPADCKVSPPVDTTPPVISIVSPMNLASVTNTIFFTVSASDNSGNIASLKLFVDGNLAKEFVDVPDGNYDVPLSLGLGNHVLSANATDSSGNFVTDPVTVSVVSPYITREGDKVFVNFVFAGLPSHAYNVLRSLTAVNPTWEVVSSVFADSSSGLFAYKQEAVGQAAFFTASEIKSCLPPTTKDISYPSNTYCTFSGKLAWDGAGKIKVENNSNVSIVNPLAGISIKYYADLNSETFVYFDFVDQNAGWVPKLPVFKANSRFAVFGLGSTQILSVK